ncbi:DUF3108 domain-containing protein [Zoogloea sp. LCSB751]|uniref:DUF3108 domain-containing protein n=1 Tax=Zoogloea sp. LCSB751 TaxID=1965277 RepID=UPI0013747597|nr:DUF3108 domain-containing protein [Zoogloea sp. LCSB751]
MALFRRAGSTLAVAIAVSLLAHGIALVGPSWRLPSEQVSVLPPLDARLTPLPKPTLREDKQPAAASKPAPRRPAAPPRPVADPTAAIEAVPVPETSPGPAVEARPETPPVAGAPEAPTPDKASGEGAGGKLSAPGYGAGWARSGRVQYNVIRGERNFIIGRTTHAWTHDKDHYSMETVVETAGLIGLLRPFKMIQRSEGRIGPNGLLPDAFTVERDGQLKEKADFDWAAGKVVLTAGERRREFALAEGDQDVLTLMHDLALRPEGFTRAELLVVTGKSAVRSVIENLGLEELDVPAGKVSAYHLGSTGHRGELKIDIWLARDYANLPIRLKITDKNGDVLDQVATGVDLGKHAPQ